MAANKLLSREALTQEMTALQNSIRAYAAYSRAMRNADPVLCDTDDGRRKGVALFSDMLLEAHTAAVWQRRSLAVEGTEWEITCNDQEHREAAREIDAMLRPHMGGVIRDILDSVAKGYSVQEIVWTLAGDRVDIDRICSREQRYFGFGATDGTLLYSPSGAMHGIRELPEDAKFIVSTYGGKSGNRYGQGVLSAAWWPFYFKKQAYLYWADGLERFGQPIPVGTFPAGTPQGKVSEFIEALQAIQTDYSIVIPEGYVVDIKDGISSGSLDGYAAFASYCDRQISKAVLSSTLTVDEGENGTRAQAIVHQRGEEEILESDLRYVAACMNNTLIRWIWALNYDGSRAPGVAFKFARKERFPDQTEIDGYKTLVSFGVPIPTSWFYKRFQIPAPQPGEEVITGGAEVRSLPPGGGDFAAPVKGGADRRRDQFGEVDRYFDRLFEATLPRLRKSAVELCDKVLATEDWKGALAAMESEQDTTEAGQIWTELVEVAYLAGLASHDIDGAAEFVSKRKRRVDWEKVPLHSADALGYLRKIIPVMPKDWQTLDAPSKRWGYTLAGAETIDVVNAFKNMTLEAIQGGEGYGGLRRRMGELRKHLLANKLLPTAPLNGQCRAKYYQAMYTAHGFARRQALLDDPDARWWRYVTVGDGAVRPSHAALDGFTARRSDPVWNNLCPPIGYNCRCRVVSCDEPETASTLPANWEPDKGFETGMTATTYQGLVAEITAIMKGDNRKNYYRDYLTGSIRTWIDKKLQRFQSYPQSALLPAPALLTAARNTATWVVQQMGRRLQNLNMNASVAKAIGNVQIRLPNNVNHLLKDSKRLAYLDYMKATLEGPLEIWESQRVDPTNTIRPVQKNYAFVALFDNGGKKIGYIVVVREDGEICTQYNIELKRVDKARRGKLVYAKP